MLSRRLTGMLAEALEHLVTVSMGRKDPQDKGRRGRGKREYLHLITLNDKPKQESRRPSDTSIWALASFLSTSSFFITLSATVMG